jgi:hypothetical protein
LIGESILNHAPGFIKILSETFNLDFDWKVGYAGFEANDNNLRKLQLSRTKFINKLKRSAELLTDKLNVSVGILPDMVGITLQNFDAIREIFQVSDFNIQRKGMDALADAVDARDRGCIYTIANKENAIILDGASVRVGRKAYLKAQHLSNTDHITPRFYCISNYIGF